mgnify:CR=1 FL=1
MHPQARCGAFTRGAGRSVAWRAWWAACDCDGCVGVASPQTSDVTRDATRRDGAKGEQGRTEGVPCATGRLHGGRLRAERVGINSSPIGRRQPHKALYIAPAAPGPASAVQLAKAAAPDPAADTRDCRFCRVPAVACVSAGGADDYCKQKCSATRYSVLAVDHPGYQGNVVMVPKDACKLEAPELTPSARLHVGCGAVWRDLPKAASFQLSTGLFFKLKLYHIP